LLFARLDVLEVSHVLPTQMPNVTKHIFASLNTVTSAAKEALLSLIVTACSTFGAGIKHVPQNL
jgi:hypothetical protein